MSKPAKIVEQTAPDLPAVVPQTDGGWLQTIATLAPVVGIEGIRELMTLRREEQARAAEVAYNSAMAEAQAELEPVARNQKNKQTSSKYADLAAIAEAAMPIIHKHGFGLSFFEFESKKPDHVGVGLKVSHRGGHSEKYEFNIPTDGAGLKGTPNKTVTHAYGSTISYGRRYAECAVFNIATKDDDDGNAAGGSAPANISAEDVEKIRAGIMETHSDVASFYQMFAIEQLEDLTQGQLPVALRMLEMKKRGKRQ